MDSSLLVIRFAKRFFAGTVLSRISGALRDVAMAVYFGSGPEIAAFMVAYRFANLFRRLFGEGSLQAGFIPHFSSMQGKPALYFYRDCAFSLTALLLLVVSFLEGVLWGISCFLETEWREIVFLTMRMLPGLLFICLYALNSAFLQAEKKYFLSGFAPVLFNCCWIAFALLASSFPMHEAMQFLSFGVTVAFALQWAITATQVRKMISLSWKEWFRPQLFSDDLKKMVRPITLGIIGVGATQLNSALDAIFSRLSDLSGPAYLWYAIRIEQLPLALFGIALSGALLPSLSRAMAEGAIDRYKELLHKGLRHSAILLVPCTFGLFALGGPGLNLLYGHGDFSSADIRATLHCLWGYGIGLLPSVMTLLLATGSYAQKSYATPTVASVIAIVFHVLCNTALVFGFHLGAFSIAVSTSLAAFVNCGILVYYCKVDVFSQIWGFFATACFCGGIALVMTFYVGYVFLGDVTLSGGPFPRSVFAQCIQFLGMGTVFMAVFLGACYGMGIFGRKKTTSLE